MPPELVDDVIRVAVFNVDCVRLERVEVRELVPHGLERVAVATSADVAARCSGRVDANGARRRRRRAQPY